jgi:hypothetical protein
MAMTRTRAIRAVQAALKALYSGPVAILAEEDDGIVDPPYAVVRIGQATDLGMGQYVLWDFHVVVAVAHDADATPIELAEEGAEAVFAALADPDGLAAHMAAEGVVMSAWEVLSTEAGRMETAWQHFGGWRLVASPVAAVAEEEEEDP